MSWRAEADVPESAAGQLHPQVRVSAERSQLPVGFQLPVHSYIGGLGQLQSSLRFRQQGHADLEQAERLLPQRLWYGRKGKRPSRGAGVSL